MMFRWNDQAQQRLAAAIDEGVRRRHGKIEPLHLLWSDVMSAGGVLVARAVPAGTTVAEVKDLLDRLLRELPLAPRHVVGAPSYSQSTRDALVAVAEKCNPSEPLGWEPVVEELIARDDDLAVHLSSIGITGKSLQPANDRAAAMVPASDDCLRTYCIDLTEQVLAGRIEPVIGRADEIDETVAILLQRFSNNPVLLGEPGVGKTAVVEGLARRIAEGSIPALDGKRLLALDLGQLLAGARYRGEFEDRLKRVVQAIVEGEGRYLLFVDELHTLIGAGSSGDGPDAANLLKPPLARGELRMIGATTFSEYRRYLEKDAAFTRRFQRVTVDEPSPEETAEILEGLRPRFEAFHEIRYETGTISRIVELAARFVGGKRFPDKAIKIMDRIGAVARIDRRANAGPQDAVAAISKITGIPVTRIAETELDSIHLVGGRLAEVLVGQQPAIDAIATRLAVTVARSRKRGGCRALLWLRGPGGCGVSTAAETITACLSPTSGADVRLDLSGFAERHSLSRLIGSPPGYQGHEEGGLLTEAVSRFPSSVVVLEELDAAHPQVLRALGRAFAAGRMSDAGGKEVDFSHCIVLALGRAPAEAGEWLGEPIEFDRLDRSALDTIARRILEAHAAMLDLGPVTLTPAAEEELMRDVENASQLAAAIDRRLIPRLARCGASEGTPIQIDVEGEDLLVTISENRSSDRYSICTAEKAEGVEPDAERAPDWSAADETTELTRR